MISTSEKLPGVFIIIEGPEGLLITKNNREPKSLELPGGGLDRGESLNRAIERETLEEIGVVLIKPIKIAELKSRIGGPEVFLFYERFEKTPELILCEKEPTEVSWENDLSKLFETEKKYREEDKTGKSFTIIKGHFAMLMIFNFWKSLSEKRVINVYLSTKDNSPLLLNNYLRP